MSRFSYRSLKINSSKGEEECRRVLEDIYKRDFPVTRPNWLKNPRTGKNLYIDCYNEELKIGLIHCLRPRSYINDLKKETCKRLGVRLIFVPYTIKIDDIRHYITNSIECYFFFHPRS